MPQQIKVSVIIPTFGSPKFLSNTIQSVVSQSLKELELIIVDDNEPGAQARIQTEKVVSDFLLKDNRIKYIKHEHNKNGAAARNTGFAIAQGKYISLLDSDDEYLPSRLQKCFDCMEDCQDPTIAGVYTGCEFRRRGKTFNRFTNVVSGNFLVETLACRFMFCTGSNIFVKKSVIDELNGFDVAFLRHQDYEFLVRLFEKYKLIALRETLVIKNNENFNLPNIDKQIAIKEQYLAKFDSIIRHLNEKDQNYILHSNFIGIAENAMAQRNYQIARLYYKKAATHGRLTLRETLRRLAFPLYNLMH